ncbi:MAG: RIP metalloprotease RseP [Rikenellaceae bacterium]|jgi:regulator of sigma E protease|nr:RIP metalloprotease RseP [Rikenellaceae bacterium]
MEILIKILQFVAALSLLVLIHEFGHFLFAKLFKCRVEKFYLFFNPWFSLYKFKIGETEYGIGWLPLGGYCKIAGMIDESMDTETLKQEPKPYEFRSKPAWQRLFILVGGVLMNVVLAIIIYIGMSMHWGDSYYATADINAAYGFEFSEFGEEIGFRDGDKIVSVDGELPENYQDLVMSLLLDGVEAVEVERDGQLVRVPIHSQYIATLLTDGGFITPYLPLVIDSLQAGQGAEQAGIQPGDRILSANGVPISLNNNRISEFAGQNILLEVARDSAGTQQVIPIEVAVSDGGTIGVILRGDLIPVSTKTYGFFAAIPQGFKRAQAEISNYFKQIKLIFTPETGAYKQVGGIIAIGNIFPGQWDWFRFWNLTAMISIMLAVVNLLPIPGLDGGHVLFVLYEMIARRKPSDQFMEAATWVGVVLIVLLLIYSNGNDVIKLFQN